MKPKNIDLANKCGSCCHFEPIEGICSGYCLRNKYGENVVHDPEHPYWQVARSRLKCVDYNKKPMTNADHIRSMTDEGFARWLSINACLDSWESGQEMKCAQGKCYECWVDWLKQPYKEAT